MGRPPTPPYQELLRAVGQLLDREGWRDVSLAEDRDGLTLRGTRPDHAGEAELRLTIDDLVRLHSEARRRRGQAAPAGRSGYQPRLRAVGWLAEVAGLRRLRMVEVGDDLLLRGWVAGAPETDARRMVDKRLRPVEIATLLDRLQGLRGSRTRELRPWW